MKTLHDLMAEVQVVAAGGNQDIAIRQISYDSRTVHSDTLFVCISGYRRDGHDFIPEALAKGASAVVVSRDSPIPHGVTWVKVKDSRRTLASISAAFYGYPASRMRVIGVTGTNGKTTTTHLIEAILKKTGCKVGLIGTITARLGDQELPVDHTTPESLELQAMLARMVGVQAKYAVMEVSSHALELARVEACEYDAGVYTNLTRDHLDFHPGMDAYLAAKAKLFAALGTGRKTGKKYAVLNADDAFVIHLLEQTVVPVITYGIEQEAMVRGRNITIGPTGSNFQISYPQGILDLKLKLTGKFSVYNALAAFTVGWQEGLEPAVIKEALEAVAGVPGRFELVRSGQPFTVVIDYAHSPDSLENVLKTARDFVRGRIITVFGCGGDRDRGKRPVMGTVAAANSDFCFITSDNPRSEDPEKIIGEILPGVRQVKNFSNYQAITSRYQAISSALTMAAPGDLVMIAGKGHETYQLIKDQILPFDDREVAKEVLEQMGYGTD